MRGWVVGRAVIRGLYERRPLDALLTLADQELGISGTPTAGHGALLAGRAQVLSAMGRTMEAEAGLAAFRDVVDHLPAAVVNDTASMYGWPEYRLRHAESFVYTYLGDDVNAERAYERLTVLYPVQMFRERAQIELHQALRLVRAGAVNPGIGHACDVVDSVPPAQRIEGILVLARSVVDTVPTSDRHDSQVGHLRELAALPAGPALEV